MPAVVPVHVLVRETGTPKRYEFRPLSDGTVQVRRHEGPRCVSQTDEPVEKARSLYRRLVKLGYVRW